MLLIYPPLAKPSEPPAGIAQLAGALADHGHPCTLLDASLEGLLYLLNLPATHNDTWSRRAYRLLQGNINILRSQAEYGNFARYQRAVADVNRVVELAGRSHQLSLSLANYQDRTLSPLQSTDLLYAAEHPQENIFYSYFSKRLEQLLAEKQPVMVGFSLNYLSQALCTFAMIGFLKKQWAGLPVVLGGGLVTSWLRNPCWNNPFAGLIDHWVAGPGEKPLLRLLGTKNLSAHYSADYQDLPLRDYLAPGFILPYAASSGCYWNKCSFCPERAEENPYQQTPVHHVLRDISRLTEQTTPALLHFLDNAVSPALMQALVAQPPGTPWYGFARVNPLLADLDFCQKLRKSGCLMLKLGLESGDQAVLDAMHKGIELPMVSQVLTALHQAGIASYVYLLFGTPYESANEARKTLEFMAAHSKAITFLNLAIFNMPVCSPEAPNLAVRDFYHGDLSLYTNFQHPKGWHRHLVRQFLDKEFKRHPAIAPIIRRDPPLFTSNHAAFFAAHC